jgi:DNA topoisomerase-1
MPSKQSIIHEIDYNLVNAQSTSGIRPISRIWIVSVGGKLREDFQQVVQSGIGSFNCEKEIFSFNAVATYSVVAEFTNEVGKAFKPNCLKFQY